MTLDVTTAQGSDSLSYEERVRQANSQLANIEAQIEQGVRRIIATIPPEQLPEFIGQLPYIVPQIPTLRYPNLPDAGPMLDRLSRDLNQLGVTEDPTKEEELTSRLDQSLSEIATKLTTAEITAAIKQAIYPLLIQSEPTSMEAALLSVALMTLDTMQPGDNPMLKQMVLQTLQDTTQQVAQLQEMMSSIPPVTEVKPTTRLLLRLGEGMARQLGRTAYLVNFLNLNNVLLPAKEFEADALRILEMSQQIQADGREEINDAEKQEQQRMMETTINLKYTEPRLARVISELRSLAEWGASNNPQRFRDMVDLANFAAGSFNLVPPGDHPLLQSLYAVAVNSLVNDMAMLQQAEQADDDATFNEQDTSEEQG